MSISTRGPSLWTGPSGSAPRKGLWLGALLAVALQQLGPHASAQGSADPPLALSVKPRGAYAAGGTSAFRVGSEYHFRYGSPVADETLEYVIDMASPELQGGVIRIQELTSGSSPMAGGGLAWRTGDHITPDSGFESPSAHASNSVVRLIHEYMDQATGTLALGYHETRAPGGAQARKTYEFRLVGKVLQIRAHGDPSVNQDFIDNYAFFHPGSAQGPNVTEQHVPYMDSVIVVRFEPVGSPEPYFTGCFADWYRSNGVVDGYAIGNGASGSSFSRFYPLTSRRNSLDNIVAPVDETMNLIVTKFIEDTFPVPPNYRSPYYRVTSGRMMVFSSQVYPGAWDSYRDQYRKFNQWGLSDLAILQYHNLKWGSPLLTPDDGVPGCLMGVDSTTLVNNVSHSMISGVRAYDPNHPDAVVAVTADFVDGLANFARRTGALFAHKVVHDGGDQWGLGHPTMNYPPGEQYCLATGCGQLSDPLDYLYPTQIPFSYLVDWTVGSDVFGLLVPNGNPAFVPDKIVRAADGSMPFGWDLSLNFNSCGPGPNCNPDFCTWSGKGYRVATMDASYMREHLEDQLRYGKENYDPTYHLKEPNAVLFDASSVLPPDFRLDQIAESGLVQSTGHYLTTVAREVREVKDYIDGPVYGESVYWRWNQAYEWGVRDGFRSHFPRADTFASDTNMSEGFVVPDYSLRMILAKAGGNSGPWESEFMSHGLPYDGPDGDTNSFVDPYFTTASTYGLNPFITSPGDAVDDGGAWTYQGILRQYSLLGGLARRMREGAVTEITYFDPSTGNELSLAQASGNEALLKNPRIRIRFANQLEYFANHALASTPAWAVTVKKFGQTVSLDILPEGFAAGDGSQIFVFFNAKPQGTAEYFDYVDYAGRWRMINTRRTNMDLVAGYTGQVYDQFPTVCSVPPCSPAPCLNSCLSCLSPEDVDKFSEGLVMEVLDKGTLVGAAGNHVAYSSPCTPPALQTLSVETGSTQFLSGKPIGFTARAIYNNAWRDVTTLATWTFNLLPNQGKIDINGVVDVFAPQNGVVVQAAYEGRTGQFQFNVVEGAPSADAGDDISAAPGAAVAFDASGSLDPMGGEVGYHWDFGDGTTAEGRLVSHVFHQPNGPYTVELTVGDVEENVGTDTRQVTLDWAGSLLWADSFDDGTIDEWTLGSSASAWGMHKGELAQSLPDLGLPQTMTVGVVPSIPTWQHSSTAVQVRAGNAQTSSAGLHSRKAFVSDLPANSGYSVMINQSGTVTVREAAFAETFQIPNFSSARGNDLRLVTAVSGTQTRVRVYVDGLKRYERLDPDPPAAGSTGLVSDWLQGTGGIIAPSLDDLRVGHNRAPFISITPLECDLGSESTTPQFYVDDQEFASTLSLGSLVLTFRAEDGSQAGQTQVFTGITQISPQMTQPVLTYETGNPSSSTWVRMTLGTTIEAKMAQFSADTRAMSVELVVADTLGKKGRKLVHFHR